MRVISSSIPEICGIATHSQDLITALGHSREIDSIRLAAIDRSNGKNVYHFPVDLLINQYDENSWYQAAGAILERAHARPTPTVMLLQHEYGLSGKNALGNDYQNMARIFKEGGKNSVTVVNLHTVVRNPNEHQKKVIQELSDFVDGIVVPTLSAIEILSSEPYKINPSKLKHIDHGIRIHDLSSINPDEVRAKYHLEGKLIVGTLGLKSTGKGIEFGIEAYGRMINKFFSETSEERKKIVYLIAGQYHPGFVADSPKEYAETEKRIQDIIKKEKLKTIKTKNLEKLTREDINNNDVIIYDSHLGEQDLRDFYTAIDIVLLPYRNKEQISSGILADAVGSGKPVIATKFAHAKELLCPGDHIKKGITGNNPDSRGIQVDLLGKYENRPSVNQLAKALEYLVFNEKARSQIGKNARSRGHEMNWENVTRGLIQYFSLLLENKLTQKSEPVIITKDGETKEPKKE